MRPDGPRGAERPQRRIQSFEDLLLAGNEPLVKSRSSVLVPPPTLPAPLLFKSPTDVGLLRNIQSEPSLMMTQWATNSPWSPQSNSLVDQGSDVHSQGGDSGKATGAQVGNFGFGLVLANLATVSFSLQMLSVKLASQYGPPSMQLLLVRFVLHSLATLACCAMGLFGFHGRLWHFANWKSAMLCAGTGLVNTVVIQLLYYATTQLSLALATVLYFTSPVWSGILKTALLGDAYSLADGGFSVLAVVAVAVVSLPHESLPANSSNGGLPLAGLVCALAAGALQALAYVIVQLLKRIEEDSGINAGNRVHWLQINISNAVFGLFVTPLTLWGPFKFQNPVILSGLPVLAQFELLGVGAFTVCAQFLLVQSQGYLDVCLVTMIRSLDVMYALIYQTVFFAHSVPMPSDVFGCALLISSCSGSAWFSRWSAKKFQERLKESGR